MASPKKKNIIPRSPWRVITLASLAAILIIAMIISYIYVTGGDRPSDDIDAAEVNDAVWGKTLDYAFASENVSLVTTADTIINLTNGKLISEISPVSPYSAKIYGSESGRVLFQSLPTVKMSSDGREYSVTESQWSVPLNGPYQASASFESTLSAPGEKEDFVSLKKYSFGSENEVSSWSMIQKDCSLTLADGFAKVSVSSSKPYFGSGKLDVDLSSIPDGAYGCVRLRVKGYGVTGIEVNYSSAYETMRLQGVAFAATDMFDEWSYVVVPVTDGNFVGELYTLYFRLTSAETAEFYVDSVEVGYIAPHTSSVSVQSTLSVYAGRYIVASSLSSDEGFSADKLWVECVIPADELLHVEAVTGSSSLYYGVENFISDSPDYTVFHFISGETVAFIPTAASSIDSISVSVDGSKVYFRTYFSPDALALPAGNSKFTYKLIYAGAALAHNFSSSYNEEARLLSQSDVALKAGSFYGYDPQLGRYMFACDEYGKLDATVQSKDDRYVYFGVTGSLGDVEIFNSHGEKLPLTLVGGDECVFGIYLEAGEETTFSLCSVTDAGPNADLLESIGYRTSSGKDVGVVFNSAEYVCSSGFYNEVIYTGLTEDGAAEVSLTVASFFDGSVSASAYDLDVSFIRNASLISLSENLRLFSVTGEDITDIYYSDVSGEIVRKAEGDISSDTVFTLSNFGPTAAASTADGRLLAGVVHDFSATANIVPLSSVLHVGREGDGIFVSATGDLLNDDTATFGLGDHIRIEAIFTETELADNGTEQLVGFREAYANGYVAAVERGTLNAVSPVPVITVSSSYTAIFSTRGGFETLPVKVEGFTSYTFPSVKVNGTAYTPSGYGVYIDSNGTVGFVFSVPANSSVMVSASN